MMPDSLEEFEFDTDFEILILAGVLRHSRYSKRVISKLKNTYFENVNIGRLVEIIRDYVDEYSKLPQAKMLVVMLKNAFDNEQLLKEHFQVLHEAMTVDFNFDNGFDWLLNKTEKFIQLSALKLAIIKSFDYIEKGKLTAIEPEIRDALSITFDENIGIHYFNDVVTRYEKKHETERVIPTGLINLDKIIRGGWHEKSLAVITGATSAGKTLIMHNFATAVALKGFDVVYLSLELSEDELSQRIDGRVANIAIKNLIDCEEQVIQRIMSRGKHAGNFVIKEFPPGCLTTTDIDGYLADLELKAGFRPDLIFVDYIGLMLPSRPTKYSNSYFDMKRVAEELRGLSVRYKVPIITANQVNRGGYGGDIRLEHASDSMGIPMTADIVISVFEDDDNDDIIIGNVNKNRFGRKGKHFKMLVDWDTLTIVDADDDISVSEKQITDKVHKLLSTGTPSRKTIDEEII